MANKEMNLETSIRHISATIKNHIDFSSWFQSREVDEQGNLHLVYDSNKWYSEMLFLDNVMYGTKHEGMQCLNIKYAMNYRWMYRSFIEILRQLVLKPVAANSHTSDRRKPFVASVNGCGIGRGFKLSDQWYPELAVWYRNRAGSEYDWFVARPGDDNSMAIVNMIKQVEGESIFMCELHADRFSSTTLTLFDGTDVPVDFLFRMSFFISRCCEEVERDAFERQKATAGTELKFLSHTKTFSYSPHGIAYSWKPYRPYVRMIDGHECAGEL